MKKIILAIALLGILQTTVAQKSTKKPATKKTTAVAKTTAPAPKTASSASSSKTATTTSSKSSSRKTSSSGSSAGYYDKGDFQINAGVGVSGWGVPVYAGLDYGVADDITVGAEVSYRSYTESSFFTDYGFTIIGIGANGNYHFGRILKIPKEWDVYGGLGLNYYIWNYDGVGNYFGANNSGISLGGQVGARYFFNKHFGVNAELGGASATSAAKIGITYKL